MRYTIETLYKVQILFATMLMNAPLSVSLFFGNLSTYMYSLFYSWPGQLSGDMDPSWMFGIYMIFNALGTLIGDVIRFRMGLRKMAALGVAVYSSGYFLTYFTVRHSVWASSLTLMLLPGLGTGLLEVVEFVYLAGWFKQKFGLASGMTQASGSVGGIVLNPLITMFINPDGYTPNSSKGQIMYFSQMKIVKRVPMAFLVLGTAIAFLQITGFLLLKEAPVSTTVDEPSEEQEMICPANQVKGKTVGSPYRVEKDLHQREREIPPSLRAHTLPTREEELAVSAFKDKAGCSKDEIRLLESDKSLLRAKSGSYYTYDCEFPLRENQGSSSCTSMSSEDASSSTQYEFDSNSDVDEKISKTPLQMLRSESFYHVTFSLVAQALCMFVVVNYNKLYGQLRIADDRFLAFTGSVASLLTILFRVACGEMLDRKGSKNTIIFHLSTCSIFLNFYYFSTMTSKWLYLVCTCILLCMANNQFLLYPLVAMKMFGQHFFATNLGLILIASLILYFVAPPFLTLVLQNLGWFWLFSLAANISLIANVLIICRM